MSDVSAIRCLHIRDEDRRAWGRAATGRNEERILRRRPDSNWGIELLQSSALPLGYVALSRDTGFLCGDCVAGGAYVRLHTAPPRHLASRKNPASSCVEVFRMSVGRFDLFYIFLVERVAGIEPARQPWEGRRLPLHHTREWGGVRFSSVAGGPSGLFLRLLRLER